MEEQWKTIEGFDGRYEVSNMGRVRSNIGNQKILRHANKSRVGYPHVILMKDDKRSDRYVHRLVAEAFIPTPDKTLQINHKDSNKTNAHYSNLEWVTPKENQRHRRTSPKGSKTTTEIHYRIQLWEKQLNQLKEQYERLLQRGSN